MLSSTDLSLVPSPLPDDLFNQAFNQQMGYAASSQKARIEQEPCFTDNTIYSAVYSGVPVFEMICRNVAVMRRRSDSYLNATQILKVAGIDKGKRTKILEKVYSSHKIRKYLMDFTKRFKEVMERLIDANLPVPRNLDPIRKRSATCSPIQRPPAALVYPRF